jgi:hypothetical protein
MPTPVRVNPLLVHPGERRATVGDGWRFRLDPEDRGVAETWQLRPDTIVEPVAVPGSWQGQGFGHDGKDLVWDFRLECRTFRATYRGTGWYAVVARPPAEWQGQRVWLHFGGAHPSAEVWLNGMRLGENGLPFVPFGFEVTGLVRFDRDNALVVRVHEANRELGFAFSWQGNWSGLYRQVEWRATGAAPIARCRLHPDLEAQRLNVTLAVPGPAHDGLRYRVEVRPWERSGAGVDCEGSFPTPEVTGAMPVTAPAPWSPDAPNLYRVDVTVLDGDRISDAWSERIGFVTLSSQGKHFCINGEPYYMRGSGDFLSCPETGCPDWDRERWRRKLRALRDYGYNYVRLQSYVYGPEYYDVADEVGLLVQSEMGMLGGWGSNTPWHVYAWPPPTPGYRESLRRQWNLIVERDVNHPSANLYCMSNELGDSTHFPRTGRRCERETKAIKPTAMVIYTDGGLNESLPQDFVNAEAGRDADTARPVVQHEFRWWSSFPDVRRMERYDGAVRPYAAELALDAAARHGLREVLADGVEASQRLQLVEAKGKMEACRRDNPRLAGICHFNAMDANPSPQGVITELYEPKMATAGDWLQSNGDTVVLCSLGFDQRVRTGGERLTCNLFVSDFSHPPLRAPEVRWELVCGGTQVASGTVRSAHTPFCTSAWGQVEIPTPVIERPARATLRVTLAEGAREVRNAWDLWLLPPAPALPGSVAIHGQPEFTWLKTVQGVGNAEGGVPGTKVLLTERLDESVLGFLRRGGRALLAASEGLVRPFNPKFGYRFGQYYFTPPANYPPYEDGHDGIIVRAHPLLGDLPHEGFADLQFFRVVAQAPPLELEPLGLNDREPVIRPLHSFPVGRSLGYAVEGAVGEGRLLVSALELDQTWPEGRYLLAAMCRHLLDMGTAPTKPFSDTALQALCEGTAL